MLGIKSSGHGDLILNHLSTCITENVRNVRFVIFVQTAKNLKCRIDPDLNVSVMHSLQIVRI